ncbi:MAG: hypothetical protein QOE61_258 [Micromonosporaceae bacterium]|jgi:RNA polymerase sigma factor (sigma-70 family)|nr:hypothetical protein [Micromonosporaceae bacterium]
MQARPTRGDAGGPLAEVDDWTAAQAGSHAAFEMIFERHLTPVYQHCFRLTASWSAAEDAAQSTFLVAWRKRDQVRIVGGTSLPWLLVIATNEVRNQQRSLRRWTSAGNRMLDQAPTADHADEVAQRVDDARRMRALLTAVRRLPRAEREVLALCGWSGMSYADAAAVLGVAEGSVRSRLSRARARLAAMSEGEQR